MPRTSPKPFSPWSDIRNLVACLGAAALLSACSGTEQDVSARTVHIGVLPGQSEDVLRERYAPLMGFLATETGAAVELKISGSYEELLTLFGERKIDLAHFGGATFLKANALHGAVPLVMRDFDTRYTSVLVVGADGARTIEDLQGKRFSFGARLSTSGHLMPRYFLAEEYGIRAEDYFADVQYSERHDRTVALVRNGKVDAGVTNSGVVQVMLADGRLKTGDVRILWETPPYTNYVWAAHPEVTHATRESLRQAFLKLSVDNAGHKNILANVNAGSYYPASIRDFAELQDVMTRMGLL